MNVIPAIDLSEGACVRLYKGDFAASTEYSRDPLEVARGFESAGAERLHVVDLDGARDGRSRQTSLVRRLVAETGLEVQVGGGIRTEGQVESLLEDGVARVVVGSLSVEAPDDVARWIRRHGRERIVLALDVRLRDGVPRLATRGWRQDTDASLWDLLERYASGDADSRPAHVLCTDIDRDGTLEGPNLSLYGEMKRRHPEIGLIASGGVSSLADLRALRGLPVAATVVGKALYEERFGLGEALHC